MIKSDVFLNLLLLCEDLSELSSTHQLYRDSFAVTFCSFIGCNVNMFIR